MCRKQYTRAIRVLGLVLIFGITAPQVVQAKGKGWFFSIFSGDESRSRECDLQLVKTSKKREIRYQENEDLIQKIITEYKAHSGSSQIAIDLSRIENRDYFETIFENRLEHAGYRVIDFNLNSASTLEGRWSLIRDRLNRKFGTSTRNWPVDGAPAISGTHFLRDVVRSQEIVSDRPVILYFKSYTPLNKQQDPISLWIESLNEQLAGVTYRSHGLIHVVISSPEEFYQLGSRGFQFGYRCVVQ
ncbi:MAG: hypothetical protein JNL01_05090 [Bdellovibrionales bacterium]|nr:hypothetical protein [Bdellovibrionales bacterium]